MSGALEIPTELLVHCGLATGVCAAIGGAVSWHNKDARQARRAILRLQALGIYREIGDEYRVRIFDLWCRSQQLEATDPQDRVFALLSTQKAVNMDMIDYRKGEATVYTEIAAQALNIPVPRITRDGEIVQASEYQLQRTDLHRVSRFLACKFRSPQSSNLPSWVPDWKPIGFNFVPLTRYFTGTASFELPYDHAVIENKVSSVLGLLHERSDSPGIVHIRNYLGRTSRHY